MQLDILEDRLVDQRCHVSQLQYVLAAPAMELGVNIVQVFSDSCEVLDLREGAVVAQLNSVSDGMGDKGRWCLFVEARGHAVLNTVRGDARQATAVVVSEGGQPPPEACVV